MCDQSPKKHKSNQFIRAQFIFFLPDWIPISIEDNKRLCVCVFVMYAEENYE